MAALSYFSTVAAAASEGGYRKGHHDSVRSMRVNPPRLRTMDLQMIDSTLAHLVVTFERDPRLGQRLTLNLSKGPTTFVRQADGRYVADIPFTAAQREVFTQRDQRIAELGPRAIHYVYNGRIPIDAVPVSALNFASRAVVADHPIPLEHAARAKPITIPDAYLGVGALTPDPKSILIITDLKVVGDVARTWDPCTSATGTKGGTWTFAHLMKSLAGTSDASKMAEDWIGLWSKNLNINGVSVKSRPRIDDVIAKWPRAGMALDLDRAPFRLLAIVYRPDLADNLMFQPDTEAANATGSAGEVRFVFDAAPVQPSGECAVKRFQLIFEYELLASDCNGAKAWAQRWIDLAKWERGSPDFNNELEKITEDVITGKNARFAQIRTNEIDLAESIGGQTLWEMREFEKLAGNGLAERDVRRTPVDTLNRTDKLSDWVNTNEAAIKKALHEVPGSIAGPNPQMADDTFWDGARGNGKTEISDPTARSAFSLNTCTGCHARESCTHFNHIIPGQPGSEAHLSRFLTGGEVVPDPVSCANQSCTVAPAPFCSSPVGPSPHPSGTPMTPSATAATPSAAAPSPAATPSASGAAADPCCTEFNDIASRQQRLDELLKCDMPNGFVPVVAPH